MSKLIKFTFMIVFIFVASIPSYAEGGGKRATGDGGKITDHGINRRVVSNKGYTGVKGKLEFDSTNVQVPSLPSDEDLSTYFKNSDYFKNNSRPYNVYSSLPTYYLGSSGSAEADAGIQYYNGDKYDAGWGAFIKAGAGLTCTPKVYDGSAWVGVHSSSTSSFDLTYYIDESDRSVWVKTSGLVGITDAFPYPMDVLGYKNIASPDMDDVFPADENKLTGIYTLSSLGNVKVKRVIGITQGARLEANKDTFEYELDGSITTLTYTGGFVHKNGEPKDTWTHWKPSIVDQVKTGYDVGQDEKDAQYDDDDTLASQYILTFPNIDELLDNNKNVILTAAAAQAKARMDTPQSYTLTEGGNSRYVHETIKISLRSATKITGEKSTVKSAN